ncbi:TPA: hypothetical protein ACGCF2_001477 [Stenotrophomonas maltophilia]
MLGKTAALDPQFLLLVKVLSAAAVDKFLGRSTLNSVVGTAADQDKRYQMSGTFTVHETKMIALGLNPGLIEDYAAVSLEPVSFEEEDSLGWATTWSAVHAVELHNGGKVYVNGRSFRVSQAKPGYKQLLKCWREEQGRRRAELAYDG